MDNKTEEHTGSAANANALRCKILDGVFLIFRKDNHKKYGGIRKDAAPKQYKRKELKDQPNNPIQFCVQGWVL
ncbi:hypothetical protein B712_0950 [Chlamydia psittaci NJ1]|nr:hypothetical protein B712_0950 [Chlamydia psittaci NJ1]